VTTLTRVRLRAPISPSATRPLTHAIAPQSFLFSQLFHCDDPALWLSRLTFLSNFENLQFTPDLSSDFVDSAASMILPLTDHEFSTAVLRVLLAFVNRHKVAQFLRDFHFDQIVWECYLAGLDRSVCLQLLATIGLSSEINLEAVFQSLPDHEAIAVLARALEVASDIEGSFCAIVARVPITTDTFEPCCRLALSALSAGLSGDCLASSDFFVGLRSLVSGQGLEQLVLFLRVVAWAAETFPEIADDAEFLFGVFADHYDDARVPLLLTPLLYRCVTGGCPRVFLDDGVVGRLFWVMHNGHFRAKVRALAVVDAIAARNEGEFLAGVTACCDGEELVAVLESGELEWILTALRFIGRVLAQIRALGGPGEVVSQWIAAGVLDRLAEMTDLDPSVEAIVGTFHSLENLIL
jgi:hypothetical protein